MAIRGMAIAILMAITSFTVLGSTISVPAGGSVQAAVDSAQPGDMIIWEAGAYFRGPLVLPAKDGDAEILIVSSRMSELPLGRVSPANSPLMPKIIAPHAEQAIKTHPGAHNYTFVGIEVLPDAAATVIYDLVRFGEGRGEQTTLASVPHHLKMDRCYIHGIPNISFQRGLSLNSSDTEITRSYISEIHGEGMDSQAIASWNTPGRNKIDDCYLEAAAENVMFGGSDPASVDFIPADTQILGSHLKKPLIWLQEERHYTVKNLLEFKIGKRILVDGCLLENNWGGQRSDGSSWGQDGSAVLFTVRNQEGSAPFSTIEDITLRNSTILNATGAAMNFLGQDNEKPSQRASGVDVVNCVFDGIGGNFITLNGFDRVRVHRVTHQQRSNTILFTSQVSFNFSYTDNITKESPYGVRDDQGTSEGTAALEKWTPGYEFLRNVVAHPYIPLPAGNDYPSDVLIGADYRTAYSDRGCDIDALLAAQSGTVVEPAPTPTPEPSPVPAPSPTPSPSPTPLPVIRIVVWPKQQSKQNVILAAQWAERFKLNKSSGGIAEFEKVP